MRPIAVVLGFLACTDELVLRRCHAANDRYIYGGLFDSNGTVSYSNVVKKGCFDGMGVSSCSPMQEGWLSDWLSEYNAIDGGSYCLSCCSRSTPVSDANIWDLSCALPTPTFARVVNVFGWEFRLLRNAYADDEEVVRCSIPRSACTYDVNGSLVSQPCSPDASYLSGYTLTVDVETIVESAFNSRRKILQCHVETQEQTSLPTVLAETIVIQQVYSSEWKLGAGWILLMVAAGLAAISYFVRYARNDVCNVCGHRLIYCRQICSPCRFYGYELPSNTVQNLMEKKSKSPSSAGTLIDFLRISDRLRKVAPKEGIDAPETTAAPAPPPAALRQSNRLTTARSVVFSDHDFDDTDDDSSL